MNAPTGGRLLVESLAAHGVDLVFGIPGTHNLEIYAHLEACSITCIGARHEQGAGYAADGYARVTGRPGVAIVTSGPGVLNAATALAQSYSDSVPVLLISPGEPVRHTPLGSGMLHEVKDQSGAMAAIARDSLRVRSVADIPATVAAAFSLMTVGRARPVHLEIPLDVLSQTLTPTGADDPLSAQAWRGGGSGFVPPEGPHVVDLNSVIVAPPAARAARPRDVHVQGAAAALAGARRPVILLGGGARDAVKQVRGLAELLRAPVITSTNGKGIFDEGHDLSLGSGLHLPSVFRLVAQADALLAVGTEFAASDWWNGLPQLPEAFVRIDIDPLAIDANAIARHRLVGDAEATCMALRRAVRKRMTATDPAWTASIPEWRASKAGDAAAAGGTWSEIIAALDGMLPPDAIVTNDSAMVCYDGAIAGLRLFYPGSFLYPTGLGTLGYALPAAIGAKAAAPHRPVVALAGDGGAMFTIAELASAAQQQLALPIVIVDNSGYGEIRRLMAERGDPVSASSLDSLDFAALGRALGCRAVTLTGAEGLAEAVFEAFNVPQPTVIHVRLRPEACE